MEASVDYAIKLCVEARTQLAADQAYQDMINYVKEEKKEKKESNEVGSS